MGHIPEKRHFPREPLNVPIWLIRDAQQLVVRAQTDNLSYGGAHLLMDGATGIDVGTNVRIRMVLPDSLEKTDSFCSVDIPAKIAWTKPFSDSLSGQIHMGLAFAKPVPLPLLEAVGT